MTSRPMRNSNRRDGQSARALIALLILAAAATSQAQDNGNNRYDPNANSLVSPDEQAVETIAHVRDLIGQGEYDRAVRVAQAVITSTETGLVPGDGDGCFVSAALRMAETLRSDPNAVRAYRGAYGVPAGQALQAALSARDADELHRVSTTWPITLKARKASAVRATLLMDAGRFDAAGLALEDLARNRPDPNVLTKLVVAWHLAEDSEAARRALGRLRRSFPDATLVLGGKSRNSVDFAADLLAGRMETDSPSRRGWPGIAAVSGGTEPMPPAPDNLDLLWTHTGVPGPKTEIKLPADAPKDERKRRWALIRLRARAPSEMPLLAYTDWLRYVTPQSLLAGSHVAYGYRRSLGGPLPAEYIFQGGPHPAVEGEKVIVRTDRGLTGLDLKTGRIAWRSEELPFLRDLDIEDWREFFRYGARSMRDTWQYGVTVSQGRAFIVGRFLPESIFLDRAARKNEKRQAELKNDGSVLAAFSVRDGKQLWSVGLTARSDDPMLSRCLFMGPPAVHGGKVYAVALYLGDYAMVCLDAETGRLLWRTPILRGRNTLTIQIGKRSFLTTRQKDWASPPVVRGDRVYMLASGAAGSFDAITGRPLWAYQYPRGRPVRRHGSIFNPASRRGKDPSNPPLVIGERLVIYPADGNGVTALSAADGKLLWHRDDATRKYLVPAGDGRVILAGPDLVELSVESGKVTRQQKDVLVIGRPAVTEGELLVGGWSKLLRLSLDTWKIRTTEVPDRGMLGNTISGGGRLISVNPAGLSAYGDRNPQRNRAKENGRGVQKQVRQKEDAATGAEEAGSAKESLEAMDTSTSR